MALPNLPQLLYGFLMAITLFFTACGGTTSDSSGLVEKDTRAVAYINKGNFSEVAAFALEKTENPTATAYVMKQEFPGTLEEDKIKPFTYDITSTLSDGKLKKIVMHNYQNSVEVKFVDSTRVNIIYKDGEIVQDRAMSLADFQALR